MARPLPEQRLAASPLWAACDGGTLIVACSGGKDSVALALAAHALLTDSEFILRFEGVPKLVLWHLDHGLRPGSAADAEFVAELGTKLGAPVLTETANLQEQADRECGNIEELARLARYGRLLNLCKLPPEGSPVVWPAVAATAHHLGDQAETVLHHIIRGTHLGGLRGIAPRFEEYVFRPWLELPPEEIPPYLESHGQDWREDETNSDTALTRNLIRHEVMPRFLRINPRAREHIARLAHTASDAHELFERELGRIDVSTASTAELSRTLPLYCEPHGDYRAAFKLDRWDNPDLLAGYLSRQLVDQLGPLTSEEHMVVGEWSADPIKPLRFRNLVCTVRERTWLVVQSDSVRDQQGFPLILDSAGRSDFGRLAAELAAADAAELSRHKQRLKTASEQLGDWLAALHGAIKTGSAISAWNCFLPESVKLPLTLRTWHEGDRMTLTDGSTKKLGDIFTDAKVPRLFRAAWAVLTDADGEVLWLPALADGMAMKIEPPYEPGWLLKLSHNA